MVAIAYWPSLSLVDYHLEKGSKVCHGNNWRLQVCTASNLSCLKFFQRMVPSVVCFGGCEWIIDIDNYRSHTQAIRVSFMHTSTFCLCVARCQPGHINTAHQLSKEVEHLLTWMTSIESCLLSGWRQHNSFSSTNCNSWTGPRHLFRIRAGNVPHVQHLGQVVWVGAAQLPKSKASSCLGHPAGFPTSKNSNMRTERQRNSNKTLLQGIPAVQDLQANRSSSSLRSGCSTSSQASAHETFWHPGSRPMRRAASKNDGSKASQCTTFPATVCPSSRALYLQSISNLASQSCCGSSSNGLRDNILFKHLTDVFSSLRLRSMTWKKSIAQTDIWQRQCVRWTRQSRWR